MIVKFVFVLVSLSAAVAFGKSEEVRPGPWYNIVSDVHSEKVAKGVCKIQGKVVCDEKKVAGMKVSNLTGTHQTVTKRDGTYEFLIPATDTAIFFYHQDYEEVVIWNYSFQEQHLVTIDCYTREALGELWMEEKPVIYAYSEESMKIEIQLQESESITHTYPIYEEGWTFRTTPHGTTVDADSQPYLFYEATSKSLDFKQKKGKTHGHFVSSQEVIYFLEKQLEELGLNDIEAAHFISYWAPRMQEKKYVFLQFWVDEVVDESIGSLLIDPKPDQTRRVYMVFQTTDLPLEVHQDWEQQAESSFGQKLQRQGLTVVEWGGTQLGRDVSH